MGKLMQGIEDRNVLLGTLVSGDRWATAALERGDDLALLRRIVKVGKADALPLAIERACMRGAGMRDMARAANLTIDELRTYIAAIYRRANA